MPYGNPQKLGEGIDPRMFVQDYSAFADAERIKAAGLMNMTDSISGAISDYAKERKDLDAKVKSGDFMLKYAEMQYPDQKEQFAALRNEMANPELSKHQQAAMADSITGMIALGTANDRYKQEYGMRAQEFALRQREAGEMSQARNFDISTAQQKQEATRIVAESVGPAKLQAAIDLATKARPEILQSMPDIGAMAPDMQGAIADQIVQLLPPTDKKRFVEKFPVTVDGVEGTLPAWVDETSGTASPVQMDGMVLPPKPGSENATPEELAASTPNPAFIPAVPAADRELKNLAIQKAKQEIQTGETVKTDKSLAAGAAVAKSQRMASLLDQLDKHPGFSGLFGFGMGARMVPGTDAAGAETLFKQIDAMGFIEAIKDMKGMGALSNAEGEKVSAALVGMDPKMPEKEARAKISEIKDQIQIGIQRQQSGKLVNPDGSPMSAPATAPVDRFQDAASRLGGMIPKRLD